MPTHSHPTPLGALGSIVVSSIKTLEDAYSKEGIPYPSLDEPFKPGPLDDDPALGQTTRTLVAAAYQIIATVRGPMETIQDYAPAMYLSSSLGAVVEANIPDILNSSGPQGLHAKEIASEAKINPSKAARIMRYLASRHVFREISPNVFANNRISSILVKGHSIDEINSNPSIKYENAPAAAFVGHMSDEGFKSATYISQFIQENTPDVAAPFNLAFDKTTDLWGWYEKPDNRLRLVRFSAAMKGSGDRFPPASFTKAVYWRDLDDGSVVVDVGGSVGSVTMLLVKAFPNLRYIVQDLDKVVKEGDQYWNSQYPEVIQDGRVTLQAHNFFDPQPVKEAAVYLMRVVLHDWNDACCHKILNNLRAAASPSSKLIVFEAIMPYASPASGPFSEEAQPKAPWPLLPNLGLSVGGFHTMVDMTMFTLFDGQERTIADFIQLGEATGWKLDSVNVDGPLAGFTFLPV